MAKETEENKGGRGRPQPTEQVKEPAPAPAPAPRAGREAQKDTPKAAPGVPKGGQAPAPGVERDFREDFERSKASREGEESDRPVAGPTAPQPADEGPPKVDTEAARRAMEQEDRQAGQEAQGEADGGGDAGTATQSKEAPEGAENLPTLARDDAALLESISGVDPREAPGQPIQEDPERVPTEAESAANRAVAERKGDLQPMHPSNVAGDPIRSTARIGGRSRASAPGERRFMITPGKQVGAFKGAAEGANPTVVTFAQLKIPESSLDRLLGLGVLIPVQEEDPNADPLRG